MAGGILRGLVCLGAVLPLVAGCSGAQSQLGSSSPVEVQIAAAAPTWDFDHDGVVTCEEWTRYAAELFDAADAGAKGYVTIEEFKAIAAADKLFVTADFAYFDVDKDGRVTRAELVDKPNPAFKLLDKNGDCRIDQSEMPAAYHPAAAARSKGNGSARQGRRGSGGQAD